MQGGEERRERLGRRDEWRRGPGNGGPQRDGGRTTNVPQVTLSPVAVPLPPSRWQAWLHTPLSVVPGKVFLKPAETGSEGGGVLFIYLSKQKRRNETRNQV